jgi:predicted nucleotidyltransferase
MIAKHGLTDKTLTQITSVLVRFSNVEKAVLFGSRAKGTHKPGSDIDLALVGDNVDWRTIGRIGSVLDDLPLPYCFSLIILDERTDPEVAAHIQRVGIPLFERNGVATVRRH